MSDHSDVRHRGLLRERDGHGAHVRFEELFFDLVYVFAVTQLSHQLLHHLTLIGALEALILWFAVWLGWQYTCWVTNWLDPERPQIRIMLFAIMAVALVMGASIPRAFQDLGLVFALSYAAIQVGRSAYVLCWLGRSHPLARNFQRILGWVSIAAVFWIAGGLIEGPWRVVLWAIAVLCEYVSPMVGFALPLLGRSRTSDWTIDGHHLAERCQLFVIVALGETILITGTTLSGAETWSAPILIAVATALLSSFAAWWMYFDTSSKDGSAVISGSSDPGRIGAAFHYVHVILVAGIIVMAVGNELVIAHPDGHIATNNLVVLISGPAIYLIGNMIYKKIVYDCVPPSHIVGLVALALLIPVAITTDFLMVGGLTTLVLIAVAGWESRMLRAKDSPRASIPSH